MPNELIKARQTIESLSRQLAERDEEFLALAAHLERVEDAALFLMDSLRGSDPIAVSDDTPEGIVRVDRALSDKSYRSLDLHDARVIHDAIMRMHFPVSLRKMWSGGEVKAWLLNEAEKYREPGKGES